MTTRKSGLLGMFLGLAILAACDPKNVIELPPENPDTTREITLNLVPETGEVTVGASLQLVAVVAGTTNQAVTYTTSNNSIATVSATGVVTGVAPGNVVITAVSTADSRARDASSIRVVAAVVQQRPTISIQSIRQGGTLVQVNTQNIQGQIDVVANADIPVGSNVVRLEVLVDNAVACAQPFTGTGDISINAAQVPVDIICSITTNAFNAATGAPTYANGPHTIQARLIGSDGSVVASATSQSVIFNNPSFIQTSGFEASFFEPGTTTAKVCANAGTEPRSLAGAGSRWCAGDLVLTLTPVIFGTSNDRLASATVTLVTSGVGTNGTTICDSGAGLTSGMVAPADGGLPNTTLEDGVTPRFAGPANAALFPGVTNPVSTAPASAGLLTFPGCGPVTVTVPAVLQANGQLVATFSAASDPDDTTPGIQDIEDFVAIQINGVTVGGQAGPACINPDPARNPATICGTGGVGGSAANQAFFGSPLRIDNAAPRVIEFDLTPTTCQTVSCFFNGSFSFAPRAGFFQSRDYGVDSQNAFTTFSAGTSSTTLATVRTGADLAETVTSNDLLLRANVTDGLGNTRNVYATANANVVQTSSTGAQRFGVDRTAPEVDATLTTQPTNNGANDALSFAIAYRDAGVGPSGFGPLPVVVKVEHISPANGTLCLDPETGAFLDPSGNTTGCGATFGSEGNGFVGTDGTFTIPTGTAGAGYYRVTYYVRDAAGNVTTQTVIMQLIDTTAPGVGAIVTPSVITGNTSTTFSASATDNRDLGDVQPYVSFTTHGRYLQEPSAPIGTYGPDAFTTSATATATIPAFIRSLETTDGAGAPTGVIDRADAINFNIRDVAGVVDNVACPAVGAPNTSTANCINRSDNIDAAIVAGISTSSTSNLRERSFSNTGSAPIGVTSFTLTENNATVCNDRTSTGTNQPCAPGSFTNTTLTASASGASATFGNPFTRVNFYYIDTVTGRSILIGSATAPTVTDVSGVRTFRWQATWTPEGTLPVGAHTVFAVGVHSSGMGLLSNNRTITLAAD